MAKKGEHFGQQRGCIALALDGLLLTTAGVLLSEALLTLSKKSHDKISVFLFVHGYLFFLVPLTFYINMLLLLQHVTQAAAPEATLYVLLNKHLPRAARVVSLANLLLSAPLWMHMSVAEESVGFAIGVTLAVLALVNISASALKKNMISSCHAGKGSMPVLFALCISTGTLIYFDPILFFSNMNYHVSLIAIIPIAIHLLFLFLSVFAFILSITLLLVCFCAQSDGPHVTIHAKNLVISPLCVAISTIVIGWYMKVYMTVTGMGYVPI